MIRAVVSNEMFTILLMVGLVFVALAKVLHAKRFDNFIYLPGNSKYLLIHTRDQKFFDRFDALLFVNLIISISIFICICFEVFNGSLDYSLDFMLKILVAVTSFILIKVLVERLLGSVFEIDPIIENYLFQKTSYKNYFGLLLIPINALFIYTFEPNKTVIFSVFGVFFILILMGLVVSFKVHQNALRQNMFYFILYLCALEIAPYIILIKLLQVFTVI